MRLVNQGLDTLVINVLVQSNSCLKFLQFQKSINYLKTKDY